MGSFQILMIDDDHEDVDLVEAYLAREKGYSITLEHCRTLSEGFERLQATPTIDLILLDLGLTEGRGLAIFQRVYTAFPQIPVIVLSGSTDEALALQAVQEGAQDYLVKSRTSSYLLRRSIRYAIERQELRLELECKNQVLKRLSEQLEQANHELEKLVAVDDLTSLHNRRRFNELFEAEWHRLRRERQPLSVIMADVDYFRAYNDTYGHLAGDDCLKQVAHALLRAAKRPADVVARYGGEEFVVALPNTDLAGAICVAQSIHTKMQEMEIIHTASPVSPMVTLSMGVVTQIPGQNAAPTQLLEQADRSLFQAKTQGRNCIQTAPDNSDSLPLTSQASCGA